MKTIAVQYLEYAPPDATPAQVREELRQAFELLPINNVILGWDLPPQLEDAVAEETVRHNATLYRWHPLLASDAGFALPAEWQPVNLRGGRGRTWPKSSRMKSRHQIFTIQSH